MALSNDLTEGSIHKHLLVFAFPLIISNIMQALYNAVDMYFTGKFMGTEGMTGVSVSGPVINVMLMFVSGFGVGVSVVIAKYLAHGRDDTLKRAANTAVVGGSDNIAGRIFSDAYYTQTYCHAAAGFCICGKIFKDNFLRNDFYNRL